MMPLAMNWAESAFQKLIYFLLIATLFVTDITIVNIFDNTDVKGKILNLTLQFFLLYVGTILFSKIFISLGRRIR